MELSVTTEKLSIVFDASSGSLAEISNAETGDAVVRPFAPSGPPFALYEPSSGPAAGPWIPLSKARMSLRGSLFESVWTDGILECFFTVAASRLPSRSLWDLVIRNTGRRERVFQAEFPVLDGVMPDPAGRGVRAAAMDQYGRPFGPAVSDGAALPWHCIWDPGRRSALGIVVRDPRFGPKEFVTDKTMLHLRHSGVFTLGPGGALRLPQAVVLAETGDWRAAAEECRQWLMLTGLDRRPPKWFRSGDIWGARLPEAGAGGVVSLFPAAPARGRALLLSDAGPGENRPRRAHGDFVHDPSAQLLQQRASFPFRRPCLGRGEAVRASLAGAPWLRLPPDAPLDPLSANWACAQATAWRALVWGVVRPDPAADDPGITARLFDAGAFSAAMAARLDPAGGGLAEYHAPYRLVIPWSGPRQPLAAVCDLETLVWRTVEPFVSGGSFGVDESANWCMCIVIRGDIDLVGFGQTSEVVPGGMLRIRPELIAGTGKTARVRVSIPGCIPRGIRIGVGEERLIPIPADARPGAYPVILRSRSSLPFLRLLRVLGA
jgi:hypothetical protein